jgi:segregation and condensation protein A
MPFSSVQYSVITSIYEGPLDLLLQLIERAELDITRLALAQVTDQYLEHLRNLPETAADEVSAFLVIAAKLVQIKSEALLPRPPQREAGEEDPGDALARQLIVYKRFKELALLLGQREAEHLHTYPRLAPAPKIEAALDLEGVTIEQLYEIAEYLLGRDLTTLSLDNAAPAVRVTIREKIQQIAAYLRQHPRGAFDELLTDRSYRLDVVVTFLALLELVKQRMVKARQENLFGQITFEPAEAWSEEITFDLEFGE